MVIPDNYGTIRRGEKFPPGATEGKETKRLARVEGGGRVAMPTLVVGM